MVEVVGRTWEVNEPIRAGDVWRYCTADISIRIHRIDARTGVIWYWRLDENSSPVGDLLPISPQDLRKHYNWSVYESLVGAL